MHLDLFDTLPRLIDMRSFSSVWFWIALAVLWSTASHWVLGIPFDMVSRAAQRGGQAERDLADMARIMTNRLLGISSIAGLWLVGFGSFILSTLAILGFWFGVQLAQAVFLMAAPLSLVGLISLSTARRVQDRALAGADLRRTLTRHRVVVQVIGMIAIFITAMWGMYQNLGAGLNEHKFGPLGQIEQPQEQQQDRYASDQGRRGARGV